MWPAPLPATVSRTSNRPRRASASRSACGADPGCRLSGTREGRAGHGSLGTRRSGADIMGDPRVRRRRGCSRGRPASGARTGPPSGSTPSCTARMSGRRRRSTHLRRRVRRRSSGGDSRSRRKGSDEPDDAHVVGGSGPRSPSASMISPGRACRRSRRAPRAGRRRSRPRIGRPGCARRPRRRERAHRCAGSLAQRSVCGGALWRTALFECPGASLDIGDPLAARRPRGG